MNNKKGIKNANAFQKNSNECGRKPKKYVSIKEANFTIDKWNHGYKIVIQICIQPITEGNLFLLKDLLEP